MQHARQRIGAVFFGGVQDLRQVKWYIFKQGNERQVHHYSPKTTHYQRGSVAQIHRFSSSFATFSLFTRHYKSWISCVCQHLKIVWESSKSDPASLSNLTRHAFALALTQKMKKCEYCQSENAPKVSQKFACQPFFLQMARAEIRTDHAGQKYTFT